MCRAVYFYTTIIEYELVTIYYLDPSIDNPTQLFVT